MPSTEQKKLSMKLWRLANKDRVKGYQRVYHREHHGILYARRQQQMMHYSAWRRAAIKYRNILMDPADEIYTNPLA